MFSLQAKSGPNLTFFDHIWLKYVQSCILIFFSSSLDHISNSLYPPVNTASCCIWCHVFFCSHWSLMASYLKYNVKNQCKPNPPPQKNTSQQKKKTGIEHYDLQCDHSPSHLDTIWDTKLWSFIPRCTVVDCPSFYSNFSLYWFTWSSGRRAGREIMFGWEEDRAEGCPKRQWAVVYLH